MLFISHSTSNDLIVDQLAKVLEEAGQNVWVDHRQGIEPGTANWDRAIRDAITHSTAGIFVMSPKALASDMCAAECLLMRELNKPFYVLQAEACSSSEVWLYIKMVQYLDLINDFDGSLETLLRVLKGEVNFDLPTPVRGRVTGIENIRLHLPYINNPFRGRKKDLELMEKMLGPHVLQILGPGGVGKSRIAAEFALMYPQGAVWLHCSKSTRKSDLIPLLNRHVNLTTNTDNDELTINNLAETKSLVVIDNAEDIQLDNRKEMLNFIAKLNAYSIPVILTSRVVWSEYKPRKELWPAHIDKEICGQIALDFAESETLDLSWDASQSLAQAARLHPRLIEFSVRQLHERNLDSVLSQLQTLSHDDIHEVFDQMILKTVRQMGTEVHNGFQSERLLKQLTIFKGQFTIEAVRVIVGDSFSNRDELDDALVTLQRWQFVRRSINGRYWLEDVVKAALKGDPDLSTRESYFDYFLEQRNNIARQPQHNWNYDENPDLHSIYVILYERYSLLAFRLAYSLMSNTMHAEDVTQEVFVEIFNSSYIPKELTDTIISKIRAKAKEYYD